MKIISFYFRRRRNLSVCILELFQSFFWNTQKVCFCHSIQNVIHIFPFSYMVLLNAIEVILTMVFYLSLICHIFLRYYFWGFTIKLHSTCLSMLNQKRLCHYIKHVLFCNSLLNPLSLVEKEGGIWRTEKKKLAAHRVFFIPPPSLSPSSRAYKHKIIRVPDL